MKRLALAQAIVNLSLGRDYLNYFIDTSTSSTDLMTITPDPVNLMWGYGYNSYDISQPALFEHLGIELSFTLDLAVGYQIFLSWLYRDDENFLIINPNVFFTLASLNYVAIKLYWIEWWFRFNVVAEKFTPLDYQALWSLDDMTSYCHSVGWVQDVFNFDLKVE